MKTVAYDLLTNFETTIDDKSENPTSIYISASCGKSTAIIQISKISGKVKVMNTEIDRGMAKIFDDFSSAAKNQKSLEMQSLVRTVARVTTISNKAIA